MRYLSAQLQANQSKLPGEPTLYFYSVSSEQSTKLLLDIKSSLLAVPYCTGHKGKAESTACWSEAQRALN